jgi:hypothetical protein
MRLRDLFEDRKKKVVAVMPGGFHPFHPGHKSLYEWAVKTFGQGNVYVAATDDTKSRPFPFNIKQQLASMAGVPKERFIQVKSPFNALSYQSLLNDAENTALVFVRSDKDQASHPKPDQIRKSDGQMGYIISYNGDLEHGADMHGYMTYGPTQDFNFGGMDIKSASELRSAWPEMDEEKKMKAAEILYPGNGKTATDLLNSALGDTEASIGEADEVQSVLPQQIKVTKMPPAPPAPTGQDGKDENGSIIKTTQKGNRTVSNGAGRYAFNPKGQLIQYQTPKIGGLQQTHNIVKKTITVNFGVQAGANIEQTATYDMSGKLISKDNTSMTQGNLSVDMDKNKGTTVDYKTANMGNIKANTKTGVQAS